MQKSDLRLGLTENSEWALVTRLRSPLVSASCATTRGSRAREALIAATDTGLTEQAWQDRSPTKFEATKPWFESVGSLIATRVHTWWPPTRSTFWVAPTYLIASSSHALWHALRTLPVTY